MTSQDGVPVSGQRSFTDPDQFHAAIRGDNGLLSFLGRGTYSAELTTVQVGRLTLQRGRENLPRLSSSVMAPNRVGMLGWIGDAPLPIVRGEQMRRGDWLCLGAGMQSDRRTNGPVDFVALTLDKDDLNFVTDKAFIPFVGAVRISADGDKVQIVSVQCQRHKIDRAIRAMIDCMARTASRHAASARPGQSACSAGLATLRCRLSGGEQMRRGDWLCLGAGMQSNHRTNGPVDFVALTLDKDDLNFVAVEVAGAPVAVTAGKVLRVPEHLGAWLLSVIDAASRATIATPGILTSPHAADSLEHALLRPMIMCLMHGKTSRQDIQIGRRIAAAQRFQDAVEANFDHSLGIPELCRTIGVSERTLRTLCQEQFGISPVRFVALRRLHRARQALLRADPHSASVTQIAMDHGIWEFGRFAVSYKALFGESPSATLRYGRTSAEGAAIPRASAHAAEIA